MSIRIPRSADVDVQAAFRDVEQQLDDLAAKGATGGVDPSADLASLVARIEQLEKRPRLNSDKDVFVLSGEQHSAGLVPDPGATAGTTKYLREDGTWVAAAPALETNQTLLGILPDEDQNSRGIDDIYQVPGSLHVTSDVSAGSVSAGDLRVYGAIYGLSRRLHTNVTDVGNVGGGEDNLMTFSLPLGILGENLQTIRVTAWGHMATNANEKLLRAYFGATGILLTVASHVPSNADWRAQFDIIRTSATAQILTGHMIERDAAGSSFNFLPTEATPAETLANSITIKMTGTATSDNDIVQKGMIVEFLS